MTDEDTPLDVADLRRRGLYDPEASDAPDRLELLRYVTARGATIEEVSAARSLGGLALALNLRPSRPFTLGEIVEDTDMEEATARQLLIAIGFPDDPALPITAEEAATVRLLAEARRLFGQNGTLQLARVAGQAMARIAETVVAGFRLEFEIPRRVSGAPYMEVVEEYFHVAQTLIPSFVRTLDALLRRQLIGVSERMWSTDEEYSAVTLERTVGFADLVGYTALTASASVRQLAEVLMTFDERTAGVVFRGNGQIVKTIGDEAMFVAEDPHDACRIAWDLVQAFGSDDTPPVRVGLATGRVLSVFGDLYGPDVNLAARLVSDAEPSTVVVSEAVRRATGNDLRFQPLAPRRLKGFADPVSLYLLTAPPEA